MRHSERAAYQALRENLALGVRMFGALLRGGSTRQYRDVLPQMAATVGVSKSAMSREAVEASAAQLAELLERRWDDVDLLVICIDGQQHGEHHVISAVDLTLMRSNFGQAGAPVITPPKSGGDPVNGMGANKEGDKSNPVDRPR